MSQSDDPTESTYYSTDEKLTYGLADVLVERYLREDRQECVTRVKHITNRFDYPYTPHNIQRVVAALEDRCEKFDPERSGATRYEIPEEYR